MKIASIDIGTNTARCLICEVRDGTLKPLNISRDIVRLGEGLGHAGDLDPSAVGRLMPVLATYRERIREAQCSRVRAVATSAMREAGNSEVAVTAFKDVLGHAVDVISGNEEARLTTLGVMAGIPSLSDGIILDIGGGSTELIRVRGDSHLWSASLPAGVVHLTEELFTDDPPTVDQIEAFRSRFRDMLLRQGGGGGEQLAGTAGTPTTLAAVQLGIDDYDPTLVNGHVLSLDEIKDLSGKFLSMNSAQRLALAGMEKGREDLIVAGTLMVLEVMERWDFDEMVVSDWGLLEGIALDAAERP